MTSMISPSDARSTDPIDQEPIARGAETESASPGRTRAAAVGYCLAWIVGLFLVSSSSSVSSSGRDVLDAFAGHRSAATAQYLLTQGVAALLLVVVVIRSTRSLPVPHGRKAVLLAGLGAATVSLVQCVLGVWLVEGPVASRDASRAAELNNLLNHLDGVKMLVLAVAALVVAHTVRGERRRGGRAILLISALAAASLAVSGVGYLTSTDALAQAAYVSLPALLAFVLALGFRADR